MSAHVVIRVNVRGIEQPACSRCGAGSVGALLAPCPVPVFAAGDTAPVDVESERVEPRVEAPVPCQACGALPGTTCPACDAGTCRLPTCALCKPVKGTKNERAWAEVDAKFVAYREAIRLEEAAEAVRQCAYRNLIEATERAEATGSRPTEKR